MSDSPALPPHATPPTRQGHTSQESAVDSPQYPAGRGIGLVPCLTHYPNECACSDLERYGASRTFSSREEAERIMWEIDAKMREGRP